ncbi:MAG: LiaF transmembrane domain-containing protein [Gammaproteobacteria bacterium]
MRDAESKDSYRHWGGATTGIVVILIGVAFLLWNFNVRLPFMRYQNWWAFFILIGAVGPLSYAWHRYGEKQRFDGAVLHSLVSAAAIILVALMFLLNLDWSLWWPLFIIIGGCYMLASHWKRSASLPPS